MKKFSLIILLTWSIFAFISCKSVGGYYIRNGTGFINDTLHYRLTIPNSSNVNLIPY